MRIINPDNNFEDLVNIVTDYHSSEITKKREQIKGFLKDIQFLRQRFEIKKIIKGNHTIIFQSRETGKNIVVSYPSKLIPFDQVLQILDQLTLDVANRSPSNKGITS